MSSFNMNTFVFAVSLFSCVAISSEPEDIEDKVPTVYSEVKVEPEGVDEKELEEINDLNLMHKKAADCTFIPDCDFPNK